MAGTDDLVNALSGGSLLNQIAHPSSFNPLAAANSAATAATNIWNVRDAQAKQAAGEAFQGAIDPSTGVFNPEKFRQNLQAAGPGAALAAQSGLGANQALSTAQVNQAGAVKGLIANTVAPLINLPDDQIHQGVANAAHQLIGMGVPAQGVIGGLVGLSNDPATMRQQLERIRQANLPPDQQQQNIYGTGGTQTGPGGVTVGIRQAPPAQGFGVSQAPGPGAPLGMAPSGPVEIGKDSTGKPIMGTPQQGKNLAEGRALNDNGPTPTASPLGTGRLPPALTNPNKAAPTPAPAATPPPQTAPAPAAGITQLPGGGYTTGQGTAERSSQEASGAAATTAFQDIASKAVAARSRGAVLDNMLADTSQFTSGPLAEQIAKVRAYANRVGIPVNTEGLSALESFKKLAAQLNTSQGSDARLAVSEASNPHADLSPAGIDLMIRQLRGNEDYLVAHAKLASQYPDQTDNRGFESKVGSNLDPRVFQYERMKPDQKWTYYQSLADKASFRKAYDWAAGQKLFGG